MTLMLEIPTDVEREKLVALAVALFDARALTQGQAAAMAGMSRVEFFDELGRRGVTPFQYTWEEEVAAVTAMLGGQGEARRAADA